MNWTKIGVIAGALVSCVFLLNWGTDWASKIDHRWAYSTDFEDYCAYNKMKWLKSDRRWILEQMIEIRKRYGDDISKYPPLIKEQYIRLEEDYKDIQKQLDDYMKKSTG